MKKFMGMGVAVIVLAVVAAWAAYSWLFCRFYVEPGYMAVVTAKTGDMPPPGSILVKKGQKGIWEEVLPEGRHFLNPMIYDWEIRPAVEIPLGKVGMVTSKVGAELPAGEIIAVDKNSKGIWRDVLGPGTYRLNPYGYQVKLMNVVNVPIGYVGIVISQTGKPAAAGEFAGLGEKGVMRDVLQPGMYYINELAYQVNIIEIGMNQVSMERSADGGRQSLIQTKNIVRNADVYNNAMQMNTLQSQLDQRMSRRNVATQKAPVAAAGAFNSQSGRRSKAPARKFNQQMPVGQAQRMRGARAESKPRMRVEAGSVEEDDACCIVEENDMPQNAQEKANQEIFGVSRLVEFPSRDGFTIRMEMTLEFELLPENIARIYMLYGDLPQVAEKIILPQVLSVSRLKGSSYQAQDFIMGEGRETFQRELTKELTEALAEKYVIVRNAIIRNVEIPEDILQPIRVASIAREQNLTNISLQETAKIEAQLNAEVARISQEKEKVAQETQKKVAEIKANQEQSVAKILADAKLKAAAIDLRRAEIIAQTKKVSGEADVKARFLVENEEAQGEVLRAKALGSPAALADLSLVDNLNEDVETQIIYAGEGTLWTDLRGGSLAVDGEK